MNKGRALLLVLSMMLLTFNASAQMVKASFGVTGGGISTMMHTQPPTKTNNYMSGYGGAFTTLNFGDSFGVRAGMNYAMQGGEYELKGTQCFAEQAYLNIPVEFLFHLKSFFSLEAGFYQNVLLSSSFSENGGSCVVTPDEGALEYNIGALAGVSINLGKMIFLNARYNYGLSKAYVIYGKGYPVSSITFGIGFNLLTTKKSAF